MLGEQTNTGMSSKQVNLFYILNIDYVMMIDYVVDISHDEDDINILKVSGVG